MIMFQLLIFQGVHSLKLTVRQHENMPSQQEVSSSNYINFQVLSLLVSGRIHPGQLRWNTIKKLWKLIFHFNWVILGFDVKLWEGNGYG